MRALSLQLAQGVHTVIGPGFRPDSLGTIYNWRHAKVKDGAEPLTIGKTFPPEKDLANSVNAACVNALIFQGCFQDYYFVDNILMKVHISSPHLELV